jgi:predicted ATPase/class 3 adenylate cyclase
MLRQLVPQFILEQFTQGRFYGRFPAATLFLDLSGFTDITNAVMQQGKEGGEAMADAMQTIFDPLVEAVYAHGGFITNFAGDAFTAVFPLPAIAPELLGWQDEWRQATYRHALAAAQAMRQAINQRPALSIADDQFAISVKIGLGEGAVEWGIVGEPEYDQTAILGEARHAYYFRGSAIDAASAAERLAAPDEIVLSHGLYTVLAHGVEAESVRHFWRLTAVTTSLPTAQPFYLPQPELDLLRIFVPEAVSEQPNRGEYRQVLTLMLNLKEVATREQLLPLAQTIFALQRTYGGYLNTINFDDKGCSLLLFWGMPTSHENDLERALNFALRLREQTAVVFRAGITYQLMYAGFVGVSRLRQEYSCYGRGVNLAARLMAAAPWGQIWVEQSVAQPTQKQFYFQPQGSHLFKGFARPQPVLAFLGLQEKTMLRFSGRMVGRQEEMSQLARLLQPLQDGRFSGLILIRGESGIGKSRLVAELQEKPPARLRHARWFHAQTDEILRQSLNPFRHLLARYFRQSAGQSLAYNQQRFEAQFDTLSQSLSGPRQRQELERVRSFLAALINLTWPDSLHEQLTGEARARNMRLALQSFFQAECQRHPVILHVSDAHWLDEDSWQALAYLSQILQMHPMAILLTSRTPLPQLTRLGISVAEIELRPLSELALADLSLTILGRPPSPETLHFVYNRSDGNPFFAEQILLYLREQRPEVAPDLAADSLLPLDVRAVLTARLDSLSPEVKRVVQHAAVLGREFDMQLLAHMLRDEVGLLEKITAAEQAAIWSPLSQLRYQFRHALLRDAAYDLQLQARRRELHQLAAAAFEAIFQHELPPHYEELIYHYRQAQNRERELHYLALALSQAIERYANHDALRFLGRALALIPAEDMARRYALLCQRETIYHRLARREEQRADLEALRALAEGMGNGRYLAETLCLWARYLQAISDFPRCATAAQEALALAEEGGERPLAATAYQMWGLAVWRMGDYPGAEERLRASLALWQQLEDEAGSVTARHYLALLAYEQGDFAASRQSYLEVLALRRALGDRDGEAATLNNLGAVANFQGDLLEAIAYTEAALQIRREVGHRQGEGGLLLNLAVMWRNLGQYSLAEGYLKQALPVSQEVGEPLLEAAVHTNFALLYHQMGRDEAGVENGRLAVQMTTALGNPTFQSSARTWLAHSLVALGKMDEAAEQYRQAVQLRRQNGQSHLVLEPLAGLARLALAAHDWEGVGENGRLLLAGIQDSPDLHGLEEPLRIYLTAYDCLLALQDPVAHDLLEQASELLRRRAAVLDDSAFSQVFCHEIPAHRRLLALLPALVRP